MGILRRLNLNLLLDVQEALDGLLAHRRICFREYETFWFDILQSRGWTFEEYAVAIDARWDTLLIPTN